MSDRFFLDTNIFVYSFDYTAHKKRKRAKFLIEEALTGKSGVVSFQIVQEFLNIATKKFAVPLTSYEAREYVQKVFKPICKVHSSIILYTTAISIFEEHKFSFYDSLVVASAIHGSCSILYSEDLQEGQSMRGISVINPFL